MAKIYSKKQVKTERMKPKKETVSFILQYSKAFSVLKAGDLKIENISN